MPMMSSHYIELTMYTLRHIIPAAHTRRKKNVIRLDESAIAALDEIMNDLREAVAAV